MGIREERTITLHPDGGAVYLNQRVMEQPGQPPMVKPIARKRVAAQELLPSHGALRVLPLHCALEPLEQGGATIFVTQEPPRTRRVRWKTSAYHSMWKRLMANGIHRLWNESAEEFAERLRTQQEFALAFPYVIQVFVFVGDQYRGMSCFYRNHPISSDADELYCTNLPNQRGPSDWHFVCLGANNSDAIPRAASVGETMRVVNALYWESGWNGDLADNVLKTEQCIPEVASPWEWELLSTQNPRQVTTLPWREFPLSVGDLVRSYAAQFGGSQAPAQFFDVLVRRVEAADDLDVPAPPVDLLAKVRPSTAQHIRIGETVLQVGDRVRLEPGVTPLCSDGGEFRILWFSQKQADVRFVQLEGLSGPVELFRGAQWIRGCSLVTGSAPLMMGEQSLVPGMVCRIEDANAWPGWKARDYPVRAARRDTAGYVHVLLRWGNGESGELIVGSGDGCFPGLRWFPPEDVDARGTLRTDTVALADGTTIRRDDRFLWFDGTRTAEVIVDAFLGLGYAAESGRHISQGWDGGTFRIEEAHGGLRSGLLRLPAELPQSVQIGGRWVRVQESELLVEGSLYRVIALAPPMADGTQCARFDRVGWRVLAQQGKLHADIRFPMQCRRTRLGCMVGSTIYRRGQRFYHRPMQVLVEAAAYHITNSRTLEVEHRDGQRFRLLDQGRCSADLVPVYDRFRLGAMELRRGMRLRLRVADGEYAAGKRFTVLAIDHADPAQSPLMITTSGMGFYCTKIAAAQFQWRDGATWRDFPEQDAAYPWGSPPAPTTKFKVGMRVRYLGGDPEALFRQHDATEELARRTLATVTAVHGGGCGDCRFDVELPGGTYGDGNADGKRYQHLRWQYLEPIHLGVIWKRVFRYPKRTPQWCRCVNPGAVVGTDREGNELRVGDLVRVRLVSSDSSSRARELDFASQVFVIVHWGSNVNKWVYLRAHMDLGQCVANTTVGAEKIPEAFRRDPSWWVSLCWAKVSDCTRLPRAERQPRTASAT
ncbi:hypothetical protein HYV74_02220 [Candidatus Uhrbacteria bacterium]|nr:hypothetical protein [Candidatus Uhrbacteria bacterium]